MGYGERLRLLFIPWKALAVGARPLFIPWKALAVGAHGRHLRCYLFSLQFFG